MTSTLPKRAEEARRFAIDDGLQDRGPLSVVSCKRIAQRTKTFRASRLMKETEEGLRNGEGPGEERGLSPAIHAHLKRVLEDIRARFSGGAEAPPLFGDSLATDHGQRRKVILQWLIVIRQSSILPQLVKATGVLLVFCSAAAATELKPPSSAELCGDCHRAIFEGWQESAHAHAMESRLFQDALKLAEQDLGVQARRVCLGCHSPIGVQTGDLDLVKKVSWEGITCDYCHSVQDVSTTGTNPKARVEFSLVKSGPYKDAVSPVHGTRYSPVHTSSLVCITCHEYKNPQGLPVLTTYSEWQATSYGKADEDCQTCHMYSVQGKVVDPRVLPSNATLNLHQIPGGHSIEQLNKAIKAALTVAREGDQVRVVVKLTNQGAGHYVPTGSPLRQLILEVNAESYAGQRFSEQRVYRRTVADATGKVVNSEPLVFVKGAKVLTDTRLAPKETKTETFTFPMRRGSQARVVASFYYYYSPLAMEQERRMKFLELTRTVQ